MKTEIERKLDAIETLIKAGAIDPLWWNDPGELCDRHTVEELESEVERFGLLREAVSFDC